MKYLIAAAAALAIISGAGVAASAQPYHPWEHGRYENRYHQAPHGRYFVPRRYGDAHRYHEGEYWRGHRLAWRNGYWGYYQPNGIFFHVNL